MQSMTTARDAVTKIFANVRELDEQVIRGERLHQGNCYAVAYVDFADDVVGRAAHLREFQERVLGDEFFNAPEQLRWNNYLYIVAGPQSLKHEGFAAAKITIEADKDYARKRVVLETELESLLGASKLFEADGLLAENDVVAEWARRLGAAGLDQLLDKPTPRTDVVEQISSTNARRGITQAKLKKLSTADEQLSHSRLCSLSIDQFRSVHNGKSFTFGGVTLIVGPNGSGKTSLLEAIEYLYCGHNRRPSTSPIKSLRAKLFNVVTEKTFELASTSEAGRIKARCLAWYKRDERITKSIVDGFTRYNFLDTDAAFRISTDLEPDEIAEDLSRLLVGSDAASLWTYLSKITSDVEVAFGKVEIMLDGERRVAVADEAELKRLQEQPSRAHSLTTNYRVALAAIGWLGPIERTPLAAPAERQSLESVMRDLDMLLSTGRGVATATDVQERLVAMASAIAAAREIETRRIQLTESERAVSTDLNGANNNVKVFDRWLAYCASDFNAKYANLEQIQAKYTRTHQGLGAFASGAIPDVPSEYLNMSLEAAMFSVDGAVRAASSNVSALEERAKTYGRLAELRSRAAVQLQEATLTLLKNGHPPGDCPICRTKHDPDALLALIRRVSADLNTPTELNDVNEALARSRESVVQGAKTRVELENVGRLAQQLGLSSSVTLSEVLLKLSDLLREAQDLNVKASLAKRDLEALLATGLSVLEHNQLRAKVFPLFKDSTSIASVEATTQVRDALILSVREIEERLGETRQELQVAVTGIANLVASVSSVDWQSQSNDPPDFNRLLAMHEATLQLQSCMSRIGGAVVIERDTRFSVLRQALVGVIQGLDEALHAALTEGQASQAIKVASERVARAHKKIELLSQRHKNLISALDALRKLINESSLEAATQDSLDAIGVQINDVFARIHAPREYQYVGKGKRLLQTHLTQDTRTLDQVSTGQRAAFALSIFLALNRSAKSAPPLLLIDDPIAHVDDLNALSFMDYLRDLAVNAKRQIFFATADSRVASLFEKKFNFLGEKEFKTIRLDRQADS